MGATYRERRNKDGSSSWLVTVHKDGKREFLTVRTEEEAQGLLNKIHAAKFEGIDAVSRLRQARTAVAPTGPAPEVRRPLKEALGAWIDSCEKRGEIRGSTPVGYRSTCQTWLYPALGDVPVNEVTRDQIGQVIRRIKDRGKSISTIGHVVHPLQTFFGDLVERRLLVTNPADNLGHYLGKNAHAKARDARQVKEGTHFFAPEEVPQVLQTCRTAFEWYFPFIATLYGTGCRFGEGAALMVKDINWQKRTIRIERAFNEATAKIDKTKSGKAREVQVSQPLLDLLREHIQKHELTGVLFPNQGGRVIRRGPFTTKVWRPLLTKAGVPYRKPHACRHTYASGLISALAPAKFIQQQLGHASIQVTFDTYGHLMPQEHQDAVERVSQGFLGVTA